MSDPFERRLGRGLRSYADRLVRPYDAVAIAEAALRTGRPSGWARLLARPRTVLVLAVAVTSLVLLGFAILGAGAPRQGVVAEPSPTVDQADTARLEPRGGWILDWQASALTAPVLRIEPGHELRMGSSLEFNDHPLTDLPHWSGGVKLEQGFGGGCDHMGGSFAVEGSRLTISLSSGVSRCEDQAAGLVREWLERAVSFSTGEEPCPRFVFGGDPAPSLRTLPCVTLRLLDQRGLTLLVYRAFPDDAP